jgi:predicted nucleic acid-binding protein
VIVVDTNIIAYFWLGGDASSDAEDLWRADPHWNAPLLWRSEFRNILAGYIRRQTLSFEIALQIMGKAEKQLQGREFTVESKDVFKCIQVSRCSAYDCEFVALASNLGVSLVTSDKHILTEFPKIAMSSKSYAAKIA